MGAGARNLDGPRRRRDHTQVAQDGADRGLAPCAQEVTTQFITQKGVDEGMRGRQHFWVSWANHGGALSRAGRGNVSPEVWAKMRVGDSVEVSRVPGDDAAHLRNGVFVEPGNFVFDFVLLALTLGVAVASAGRLLLWWYYPGKKEAHERRRPWQPEAPARDRRHPSLALRAAKEAPSFGDQLPCRWNTEGGKRPFGRDCPRFGKGIQESVALGVQPTEP